MIGGMRLAFAAVGFAVLTCSTLAAQDPSQASSGRHIDRVWAADLPEGWRQLGREEAADVRNLPFDTPAEELRSALMTLFGPVDRWKRDGFAGGALAVASWEPEETVDQAFADKLRQTYEAPRTARGERRVVDSLQLSTIGPDQHPAILMEVHGADREGKVVFRSFDVCTGTSGQLLILSFRAWENEWHELEPKLRAMASSLTFARPPRQKGQLGDALLQAAVFGGIFVVALLALRSFLRRRPLEHQPPSARERGPESGGPSQT